MEEKRTYAEVIVDLNVRRTDRPYYYAVPDFLWEKVGIGSRVLVPFNQRRVTGYVVGFGSPGEELGSKIKEIAGLAGEEPVFTGEMLALARWLSENYLCTMAEAFGCMLAPSFLAKGLKLKNIVRPAVGKEEIEKVFGELNKAPKQLAVMKKALEAPGLTKQELARACGVQSRTVDALVKKGFLAVERELPALQHTFDNEVRTAAKFPDLNEEQKKALEEIKESIAAGKFGVFLLHGVTGSGKTEVYMRAVAAALEMGRQALVLVPEISLTPQMINLFGERFGPLVAVLHSALPGSERYREWWRIKEGLAPVVLGTRSAVFAPFKNLGFIVIDEEHESSYKQDDHLRYHAREVALKRAQFFKAAVVLGSATPSLESHCRAAAGGPYRLLKLTSRIDGRPLPKVRVVDMRKEFKDGRTGLFSRFLTACVDARLERGEQVLLFLNRRGYATVVSCLQCGEVLKCPNCDISMTYHLDGRVHCHYCGHTLPVTVNCARCGGPCVRYFGAGTQKVEDEARRLFPGARILRMDSDSTSRRGSHQEIFQTFVSGGADILIGTQMVAKGLDMPGVTLVGVINADVSLHMPDFRAAERTFQLLTQVAGRSGRGSRAGEVVVQTFNPEHYSIACAASYDYESFYRREMKIRRALAYPPFVSLARLLFTHECEEEVELGAAQARQIFDKLAGDFTKSKEFVVLGPAPPPLGKIKNRYRRQIVVKGPARTPLKDLIKRGLDEIERLRPPFKPAVHVDINPQGML